MPMGFATHRPVTIAFTMGSLSKVFDRRELVQLLSRDVGSRPQFNTTYYVALTR